MAGIIITREPSRIPSLRHRSGAWVSEYKHGFHITQYLDPGEQCENPMNLKSGGLLLFDGQIYNHPEEYKTSREYLLALFDASDTFEDVEAEANSWDGSWSIVYITNNGFMHCLTDPLGKKQLYYNDRGEICSEIRPLMSGQEFDPFFKSSVFKWGYNTTGHTPWEHTKRMFPNMRYVFVSGSILIIHHRPYYKWGENLPKDSLRNLLIDATRIRSREDNMAILVSGGLDSAIIARILVDQKKDVKFYTVENNETVYAKILANDLGVDLNYLSFDTLDDVEEVFRFNETPIDLGSVLPQHRLMSSVPEHFILGGDGADELFGGYKRSAIYDSQRSDIFEELTYYHLPRLDRAAGRFQKDLRSPFLAHPVIKFALSVPYENRIGKKVLKDAFRGYVPDEILDREKIPLKNDLIRSNKEQYKNQIFNLFYNQIFKK